MIRTSALTAPAVAVAAMWAGHAAAADKPVYAAPAAWVDVAPIPAVLPGPESPAIQVLLDDNQTRLERSGGTLYNRRVVRIVKTEGLSGSGSRSVSWNPTAETVTLHTLSIRRGDQVIDLLQGGKDVLVIRRETNLERAMLDGRLTASVQIKDLQVGDVVDWAYTVHRTEPLLDNRGQAFERMGWGGKIGRYRVRIEWPQDNPVIWKTTTGFPQPAVTKAGGFTRLAVDLTDAETPKAPAGAPLRFLRVGELQASTYADWAEISRRMYPLYDEAARLAPDSPVRAEVARIAAHTNDPKERTFAALQLVEDKTRYLALSMGDGGYRPAPADETWARRFGDCKGKTVLLLALLRELGVDAEPAIVSTTSGDGMDERVAAAGQFNHIIVRARIDGKSYWLDGTRSGDRGGLDLLRPPGFRWALPVRAKGAGLEPIEQPPLAEATTETKLHIDASAGLDKPAPVRVEILTRGDAARAFNRSLETAPKADVERALKQSISRTTSWITLETVEWVKGDSGDLKVVMTGTSTPEWRLNDDLGVRELKLDDGEGRGATFPRREPGPNDTAPFALRYPSFSRGAIEVVLPNKGEGFSVKGANGEDDATGYRVAKSAKVTDGVARFETVTSSEARELPFAQVEAANAAIRKAAYDVRIVRAPKGL
jgi:transglutaminase-like putative cysteine protease